MKLTVSAHRIRVEQRGTNAAGPTVKFASRKRRYTCSVRCLWLSGDVPYPADSGRRAYSAGLSEALAAAGVGVIGLGSLDPPTETPDSGVDWHGVAVTSGPGSARRLFSRWPAMAVVRQTPGYQHELRQVLDAEDVDVAVVDHLQMVWAVPVLEKRSVPIVYASQNHEASIRRRFAAGIPWSSPRRPVLAYDAERAARAEGRLVRASRIVTAITESDARAYRADGAEHVVVVPPGYSGTRSDARTLDEHVPRDVIMVSNLDWHVKQANLRRLLAVADGKFADAGITLRIVGPAPQTLVEELAPRLRATEFVGRVPSLETELAKARVGIIFEPDGGGFKLKSLDYVFGRVPMAVLSGSAEGLPLEPDRDYLSFESAEALARGVIELVDDVERCQTLQQRAFDRCADAFDWADRGKLLAAALTERVVR